MRYLLLLACFATGACKDRGIQPKRTVSADSADQVLAGMTTTTTRNGVRTSVVQAESTWVYSQRQVNDLKGMTVTMFDSSGAVVSKIIADRGVYDTRANHLDARGHVVATSSEGKVLKTEHLIFDNTRNLITSDSAFTSTSPKASAAGASFESDPGFKKVTIHRPRNFVDKGKGIRIGGSSGGTPK